MEKPPTTPIEKLKNIGPKSAAWLREIGVLTLADLEQNGPVLTYKILQHRFKGINILMLYGLYGALYNKHWNGLSPDEKTMLQTAAKEQLDISFGDTE